MNEKLDSANSAVECQRKANVYTLRVEKHRYLVSKYMDRILADLEIRSREHDASKLGNLERDGGEILEREISTLLYNSEEYLKKLVEFSSLIQLHYLNNQHHPEFYVNAIEKMCPSCFMGYDQTAENNFEGVCVSCKKTVLLEWRPTLKGMTLVDIIEMLCDWRAVNNGNMHNSIDVAINKYGISKELAQILRNTAEKYLR
jgi:protein-arginine kinase activator protein McsA